MNVNLDVNYKFIENKNQKNAKDQQMRESMANKMQKTRKTCKKI